MSHLHSSVDRLTIVFASVALLTACGGGSGPSPEGMAPGQMNAHFNRVGEIRDAVLRGDVGATRAPARWLAAYRGDDYGVEGEDALEMMRVEALIIGEQDDILQIGRSVARMGMACGSCHTATKAGPSITVGEPPASSTDPSSEMVRHAWGAERLWEGLVGPSDLAWEAGASALSSMPPEFGTNDQANRLAQRVRDLGQRAQGLSDPKDRAQMYGNMVETCSLCHNVLEMRGN